MPDSCLYDDVPVLRNKLDIKDEKTLDIVEAELSRTNMMLLYEQGFEDFSPVGLREIHRTLFGDIYEWAGEYRVINIEKRERLLAGRSVWYSNDGDIPKELENVFQKIHSLDWAHFTKEQFIHALSRYFPHLWQIHPFREGNTRTIVMMLTFFVEKYGYYMDQDLMAASAGYVRDAFVMASIGQYAEHQHLERILLDAVCDEPVTYDEATVGQTTGAHQSERYQKYQNEKYVPQPHYKRED